jgi:hypothetical protein
LPWIHQGRMFLLVSIGQVTKFPLLMALKSVDVDGLKRVMWRNLAVLAMVPAITMLLARPRGHGWLLCCLPV